MTTFRVRIEYDQDTENPTDYGIARLVSFNSRHIGFEDPYTVLACKWEGEITDDDGDTYTAQCENGPHADDDAELYESGYGNLVPPHEYVRDPDILAVLSYGEHGLSKWWVSDGSYGTFGHWDSVQTAGVLIWNAPDSEREWWDDLPDENKAKTLDSICEEYTDWVNGECYYYMVERQIHRDPCIECGRPFDHWEHMDSCGGYIGGDYTIETIAESLSYDVEPGDTVEVRGEAAGLLAYHRDLVTHALEIRATREARERERVSS